MFFSFARIKFIANVVHIGKARCFLDVAQVAAAAAAAACICFYANCPSKHSRVAVAPSRFARAQRGRCEAHSCGCGLSNEICSNLRQVNAFSTTEPNGTRTDLASPSRQEANMRCVCFVIVIIVIEAFM